MIATTLKVAITTGIMFFLHGLLPLDAALRQGNPENQVVGLTGSCEAVTIAGANLGCAGKGIIYIHLRNGVVLFNVPLSDGRVLAFIGEKDSQLDLREYHLYLSRARVESTGSSFVTQVAGQCITRTTADGTIWSRVDCDATDEKGERYRLRFAGAGERVQVLRSP